MGCFNCGRVDEVSKMTFDTKQQVHKIRNVWTKKDNGDTRKALKETVPGHDILMLRLTRSK